MKRGFTLLELMICIAIIGVLILVFMLNKNGDSIEKANDIKIKANMKTIEKEVIKENVLNGDYPTKTKVDYSSLDQKMKDKITAFATNEHVDSNEAKNNLYVLDEKKIGSVKSKKEMEKYILFVGSKKQALFYQGNKEKDIVYAIINEEIRELVYRSLSGKQLCIFYGWGSYVNKASGVVTKAVTEYKNCDLVVFGKGLEQNTHTDHSNTKTIIDELKKQKPSIELFGYIDVGVSPGKNKTEAVIKQTIIDWKAMGITGIFVDESGYDFGVTRNRQLNVMNEVRNQGLKVFANAFQPDDVLGVKDETGKDATLPLKENDWFLIEDLFAEKSDFRANTFDRIQKAKEKASEQNIHLAGVTTVNKVTDCKIGNSIYDYSLLGSYLFDLEAFQCADASYGGGSDATIAWNTKPFMNLSENTEWTSNAAELQNGNWVRKTKDAIYQIETAGFFFEQK